MLLLEQYEELIERDPIDISYAWKLIVVIAYLSGSISSYACALLFYTFWKEVCGGHCLFWASAKMHPRFEQYLRTNCNLTEMEYLQFQDWPHQILVYHNARYCKGFQLVCMLSCTVSICFLILFSLCGKGGHDKSLFVAPWRVVLPAIGCNFVMTIMTAIASHLFTQGYFHFSSQLYQIANEISYIRNERFNLTEPCDAVQSYTSFNNVNNLNSCNFYWLIRMTAWIMTWSWIISMLTLCLRILTFVDFTLMKVKVFEAKVQPATRQEFLEIVRKNRTSSHIKEIKSRGQSKLAKIKVL